MMDFRLAFAWTIIVCFSIAAFSIFMYGVVYAAYGMQGVIIALCGITAFLLFIWSTVTILNEYNGTID